MKIKMFYHSLVSDWNHGNAHFLRGVVRVLKEQGHEVTVYEPESNWSLQNLKKEKTNAVAEFKEYYPKLSSTFYKLSDFNLEKELKDVNLVLVHEWNDHTLVKAIGEYRAEHSHFRLLFHDTHHRSVTDRESMNRYDLSHYDGVLAFGNKIRDIYLQEGWTANVWTWHEAADTHLFRPMPEVEKEGDLVWIGNWGDDERERELQEFLIEPVKELGLKAKIYGVRYPERALKMLEEAGISYGGYLPNYKVPEVFARYKVTVHVPRRPYVEALPGIPTIRPFEAMACGIPHVCSPWEDAENLFRPGQDYLVANNKEEMKERLQQLLSNETLAQSIAFQALKTIRSRHTCAIRVEELMSICAQMGLPVLPAEVEGVKV